MFFLFLVACVLFGLVLGDLCGFFVFFFAVPHRTSSAQAVVLCKGRVV